MRSFSDEIVFLTTLGHVPGLLSESILRLVGAKLAPRTDFGSSEILARKTGPAGSAKFGMLRGNA